MATSSQRMKVCERSSPSHSMSIYRHSRYIAIPDIDTNCAAQSGAISGFVYMLLHRFQENGLSRNALDLRSGSSRFETRPVHLLCRHGVVSFSLSDKYRNRASVTQRPLPSTCFSIHCWLSILPFDTIALFNVAYTPCNR